MACRIKLNLGGLEAVCTSEGRGGFKSVRSSCPSSRLHVGDDFGVILDLKPLRVSCYSFISVCTVKKVSSGVVKRRRKITKLRRSKNETSGGRCCHTLLQAPVGGPFIDWSQAFVVNGDRRHGEDRSKMKEPTEKGQRHKREV